MPSRAICVTAGLHHPVHDDSGLLGRENAAIAIGAHASGVGSGIAVADPLMVLRSFERQDLLTVTDADKADFFAFEKFFDDQTRSQRLDGSARLACGLRDDDTLAGGESISFDHHRQRKALYGSKCIAGRTSLDRPCRGDAGAREELLAKILLPSSCAAARVGPTILQISVARNSSTMPATSVASGPTTVRSTLSASARSAIACDGDWSGNASPQFGKTRIARRGDHLGDLRRLLQAPRDGVFAASAADDQDFQSK